MEERTRRGRRSGGNAVIEVTLLMPWFVFLFMGVFDFGFYAYALISTENAARAAALYSSTGYGVAQTGVGDPVSSSSPTCRIVLGEMRRLPNVGTAVTSCDALPVRVKAELLGPDPTDGSWSSRVTVTYQTVQLFPIPGLTGRLTANRSVEMRIFGE